MTEVGEHQSARERVADKSVNAASPKAFLVYEALHPQLATLMGNIGFNALLSRALALASAELPWLSALQVAPDGSFEGLTEAETQVGPEEFSRGSEVLLAHLLDLLATFIGRPLTLQLVQEVWPQLSSADFATGEGIQNEKPK